MHFILFIIRYFWTDEGHLEIFALSFDTLGAVIDFVVAIWILKTLNVWIFKKSKPLDKEEEERQGETRERLEYLFGAVTATLLLVSVICGWRIIVLHVKSDAASEQAFDSVSNRLGVTETNFRHVTALYDEATNDLSDATAKLAKFSSLTPDRVLTKEQELILVSQLLPISANTTNKFINLITPIGDFESMQFAKQIGDALTKAGFSPELTTTIDFSSPAPTGIDFASGISNTNAAMTHVPSPLKDIIFAFGKAGIPSKRIFQRLGFPDGEMFIFINHNDINK